MEVEVEVKDLKRIQFKPFITIVTKRVIFQENTQSFQNKKTSISLGNLYVGDWCW